MSREIRYHKIEEKLQKEIKSRHQTLDKKLNQLTQAQTNPPQPPPPQVLPQSVNTTDIPLSNHEMSLLQKGPKYNLHNKPKNWIQNLALETETAISHLPLTDKAVCRKLVAQHISTLQKNTHTHTRTHARARTHTHTHQETRLIKSINTKLKKTKL